MTITSDQNGTSARHDTEAQSEIVVAANRSAATVNVVGSVAEDTIFADHMLIRQGANSVALFANPFTGFTDEMLFVGIDDRLSWARHRNDEGAGWELVDLDTAALEVVTVVHPRGAVFAFVLVDEQTLRLYVLEKGDDGTTGWVGAAFDPSDAFTRAGNLSVQYQADRPAGALVFVVDQVSPAAARVVAYEAEIGSATAAPTIDAFFLRRLGALLPTGLSDAKRVICGVDGFTDTPSDLMVWILRSTRDLEEWTVKAQGAPTRRYLPDAFDGLAGLYVTPRGVGALALRDDRAEGGRTVTIARAVGELPDHIIVPIDHYLDESRVWQDNHGRMHLFGLHGDTLHVAHQVDVRRESGRSAVLPVWDTMANAAGEQVIVTRPLAADVASYAVDAQPDEYPSQHIMHSSGPLAERCAIYTQDVDTTWWSRENVRLPATTIPYKVSRYQAQFTVVDSYGTAMVNFPVTVTSSQPMDIEVLGAFYRIGPDRGAQLTTNVRGQVIVRAIADSLAGATLTLSAKGLAQAATYNPASDVHQFLAGKGTLPNHGEGISADRLRDAKTPSGDHVFPAWHTVNHGLAAVPDPEQVLTWCREVLAPRTGKARVLTGPDGAPVEARYLVIQTWDGDRHAFETYRTADDYARLTELRAQHPQFGGWWEDAGEFLGDIWEGVKQGAIRIVETAIDVVDGVATIFMEWIDGLKIGFTMLWDDIVSAAHLVESVFNAILAKIESVIDWLKWLLDLKDVLDTKDAFIKGVQQWSVVTVKMLNALLDQIGPGWFQEKEELVRSALEADISALTGISLSPPPQLPPAMAGDRTAGLPEIATKPEKMTAPHTQWMDHQLGSPTTSAGFRFPRLDEVPPEFQEAADAFWALMEIFEDPGVGHELVAAFEKVGELFTNLFDVTDVATFARTELATFIGLAEHVVLAGLKFADTAVQHFRRLIVAVIRCIPAFFALELTDAPLLVALWNFICDEAGVKRSAPTMGDFFGTVTAFPITVIVKAITGQVPFPDGFPDITPEEGLLAAKLRDAAVSWIPKGVEFSEPSDYYVPVKPQLAIQVVVGVGQICFSWVDVYMNNHAFLGDDGLHLTNVEYVAIAMADLLVFGVGDLPLFWGVERKLEGGEWMWWGEYGSKIGIYLGDMVCAALLPFINEKRWPARLIGTLTEDLGNHFISLLGWIETTFSLLLWIRSSQHKMDDMWLGSQLVSMVSSDSAFVREMPIFKMEPPVPYIAKNVADVAADFASGLWFVAMAVEAARTGIEGEINVQGVLEQPLDVDPVRNQLSIKASIDYPPYGWALGQGRLPAGLDLQTFDANDRSVRLVGKPEELGTFNFTLVAGVSYDPNLIIPRNCTITIEGN